MSIISFVISKLQLKQAKLYQIITAIASTVLLGLTFYTKYYDLLTISDQHKRVSLHILEIREQFLSLLIDVRIRNISLDILQERRDNLNDKLIKVYNSATKTTRQAYKNATKSLKKNKEFTFSEEEIDRFLPPNLRKGDKN